jgi:hypothetical protein
MNINYKKKVLLIVSLMFFLSPFIKAQATFQKIYPSSIRNQSGTDVLPGIDGGYIIVGSTETSITNDLDIEIMKTDDSGDTLWTKRYGGSKPDYPNNILKTNDGNYFVIGYTQSFGTGDYNNYLLKLKPNGDTIFTKVYGGFGNEDAKEIVATADGNYVIVGGSNSVNYANNDVQLIKINAVGDIIWTKYYGGPNYESARSVKLCSDGGFIMVGKTATAATSVATMYLVRTDLNGDTLWTKKIGGANSYEGKSVIVNTDGSYTIALDDSSATRDSDVRVMNIDATGKTIIWNKMYGGLQKDIAKMIQSTSDGGYIIASISRSFGWVNPDMWLIKLDASGNSQWTHNYGGAGHEHCFAVRPTADGDYIAIGHSKSYSTNGNTQIMFVKVDPSGNVAVVDELAANNIINVYPNPSRGIIKIDMVETLSKLTVLISNALGQTIYSEAIDSYTQNDHKVIDLNGNEPGVYFVTVQSPEHSTTKKLILN